MADEGIEITINDAEVRRAIHRFGEEAADGRKPLELLFKHFSRVVRRSWRNIRATGGTFRGQRWPAFKAQYKRMKDGAWVPAWGGVPKVRGRGMVKGRKRPSGEPVTPTSIQLQDTGTMRDSALTRPTKLTKEVLQVGVSGTARDYAKEVSKKRDWLRWTKDDEKKFADLVRANWAAIARKHGFTSR